MKLVKKTITKDLWKELSILGIYTFSLTGLLVLGITVNTLLIVLFGASLFIFIFPYIDRIKYVKYCLGLLNDIKTAKPEEFIRNNLVDQHVMFRNTDHSVITSNSTKSLVREIGLIEKLNKLLDNAKQHIDYDEKDPFFEYYKNKTNIT